MHHQSGQSNIVQMTSVLLPMLITLSVIIGLCGVTSQQIPDSDSLLEQRKLIKRPFCNAFTGCGRKRSSPSVSEQAEVDMNRDIIHIARLIALLSRAQKQPGSIDIMSDPVPGGYMFQQQQRRRRTVSSADDGNQQKTGNDDNDRRQNVHNHKAITTNDDATNHQQHSSNA